MTNNYSIIQLFQDITNQASVDRAGNFLLLAQTDYPWLFESIVNNLDKPPAFVLEQIKSQAASAQNLMVRVMAPAMLDSADPLLVHSFISKLQAFFKEKGF